MPFAVCPDRRGAAAGFTLIEVVAAMAILGLTLAAVLPQFGTALRLGGAAAEARLAVLVAESALDELSVRPDLAPGTYDGTAAGGVRWVGTAAEVAVRVEPARTNLRPLRLEVGVFGDDGRLLTSLTTVTLGGVR